MAARNIGAIPNYADRRSGTSQLLAASIAIVVLAVWAGVMWWKRRPAGSLSVPRMPADRRVFRGLLAILVIGGLLFPLAGLSPVVMPPRVCGT